MAELVEGFPLGAVGDEAEEVDVCSWVYGEQKGGESM